VASAGRYRAIIADEGQDFREEWWIPVQAALVNEQFGIMYVFHDDNKALLPFRSKHPVEQAPFSWSRNCRNVGAVFDLVRRFHKYGNVFRRHSSGGRALKGRILSRDRKGAVWQEYVTELLK
jgi:hypothetical protein